ncbi:MAG: hypothetical protein U0350_22485 [Caldilineaceae bacterium]
MMIGTNKQTYEQLLIAFLPRAIKDKNDYAAVQKEIDRLIDQDDLSPAEQDYLDLLGTLLWEYEVRTEPEEHYELRGIAFIKGLMDLHGLKQKDLLPIFKTKSIISAVLSGQRKLTAEHINRLAAFFHLPHTLFFEPISNELQEAQLEHAH